MAQEAPRGVRVPPELHGVPPRSLEEYSRARILQFAQAFAARLNPTVGPAVVQQAAVDCLASLPPADYSGVALEQRDLQLVFRHDCLSLGCLDAQCVLCEHNPHRRCSVNFSPKYLVNDVLKAKCDAPIRVELIDRTTGQPIAEDLPDITLEMCVLDGNMYDSKVVEAGEEREGDLEACALLLNNKAQALLGAGGGATHNASSKVQMPLTKGVAVLPDLHISDSSEAMLSGRKPPFRLLVKAVHTRGQPISIRHAVSEGFVVATRRTRTAGKLEIPNVDDHISKLEHMGKETVKKLADIRGSAVGVGMEVNVPDNTINKVGEFRKLALLAEADGHLRQKLQQVLKLSKEKWEEARDHAMRAVVADNRMRIWYADKANMEVGLLFTCRLGDVDLDRPVGLLTKKAQEGAQTTMEATLMAQQTPAQRDQVRALQPQAVAAWWQGGHPGWAIYPVDSEQFLTTGALENVNLPLPSDAIMPAPAASPMADPGHVGSAFGGGPPGGLPPPGFMPGGGDAAAAAAGALGQLGQHGRHGQQLTSAAAAGAFNPALASAFMNAAGAAGGMPSEALLRAMSPLMHGAGGMPGALNPFMGLPGGPGGPPSGLLAPPGLMGRSGGQDGSPQHAPTTSAFAAPAAQGAGLHANGANGSPTPFAGAQPPTTRSSGEPGGGGGGHHPAGPPQSAPSFNFANLSSLFGGDLTRLPQLAGQLNLPNFPSIPPGMMSGDLEQLLAQGSLLPGGDGSALFGGMRAPSFSMGKLESLNLPDDVLAAAIAQMERAAGGGNNKAQHPHHPQHQQPQHQPQQQPQQHHHQQPQQQPQQHHQQQQQQQHATAGEPTGPGNGAGQQMQESGALEAGQAGEKGGGEGGGRLTPQKRKQ